MSNPFKITNADLLKFLDKDLEAEVSDTDVAIGNFLSIYNLSNGENLVSSTLLYDLYKLIDKKPISFNTFNKSLVNLIKSKQVNSNRVYFLSKAAGDLKDKLFKVNKKKQSNGFNFKRHFKAFITYYDLKSSNTWIEDYVLYYLYDTWCYINKAKYSLSLPVFRQFCNLTFKQSKITPNLVTYYGITDSIYNILDIPSLVQLREGWHKRHGKKQGKNKKETKKS